MVRPAISTFCRAEGGSSARESTADSFPRPLSPCRIGNAIPTYCLRFRGEKKPVLDSIRECVRESQANIYTKIDGFVFNFTEFHREKKPILQALNVLAHDVTCVDPKEAFVDWFLDDWCKKEFDGDKDAVESATAEPHKA